MSVSIAINNARTQIVGTLSADSAEVKRLHEALRKALSYEVPGADWSAKFKEGTWDGLISLYYKRTQSFPTGLASRVIKLLGENGISYSIDDKRVRPDRNIDVTTTFAEQGRTLHFYQNEAATRALEAGRGIIALATGGGKAIHVDTPMWTARGWTTMGEVLDGDVLFDENGDPTTVLKAHDVLHERECFEIKFSSGETIVADAGHLWSVRISPAWNKAMPPKTLSTEEMFRIMQGDATLKVGKFVRDGQGRNRRVTGRALFFIEQPAPLNYLSDEKLPLDPYVLGAWLGDSNTKAGGFTSADPEIIESIRGAGFDVTQDVNAPVAGYTRGLVTALKSIGVFGDKHIPMLYKTASFKQRWCLLQGIVDTDGTVALDGQTKITLCDERLANDTFDLILGLGIRAMMTRNAAYLNGVRHKDRFRIKFTTSLPVARLERKAERLSRCRNRLTSSRIYIKSITPVESRPVRCLTVDSPSRLYLAGRTLIPTHNTVAAVEMIARAGVAPFLFVVPAISLLKQTKKEFERWLRVDGKSPHIGMVGNGICDINMNGVNICTYQTILLSYDESYKASAGKDAKTGAKWGANSVVEDPYAGDKIKKTTEELEDELRVAGRALRQAEQAAAPRLQTLQEAVDEALSELRGLELAYSSGSAKKALVTRAEIAHGRACRAHAKEKVTLTRAAIDANAKANKAYEDRLASVKKKADVRALVEAAQGIIVDEVHLAAVVIETILSHAENAYFKWGLSATPFREDNQEIRIEGAMGRKLVQIGASDLISLGFLVPANIFMAKIGHIERCDDYTETYEKHITKCWERNWRIKRFAEEFKAAGRPVLILVERVEHGQVLEGMIAGSVFIAGSDKGEYDPDDEEEDYRRRMLNQCEENKVILICTSWAYTGVDAPAISTLILAGSCQSAVTTYQQVGRVLRTHPASGKEECVIIDFMDAETKMHEHSLSRRKVYKGEPQFQVRVVA